MVFLALAFLTATLGSAIFWRLQIAGDQPFVLYHQTYSPMVLLLICAVCCILTVILLGVAACTSLWRVAVFSAGFVVLSMGGFLLFG
jgi:hypothetical protein